MIFVYYFYIFKFCLCCIVIIVIMLIIMWCKVIMLCCYVVYGYFIFCVNDEIIENGNEICKYK